MDNATMQRMRKHIKENEGVIERPYRDNKGLLTAGAGFKVTDENSFAQLPFQVMDAKTGQWRDAKDEEKRAEFKRIQSMSETELKKDKNFFKLPDEAIDKKVDEEIATRVEKIKGEVGAANWDRLTDGQKTAVLDVHYANGSLGNYPKLTNAIKDGNAEKIGKNVDFHSDGARNWGRIKRNRAEAQGISLEEAERQVEEDRKSGKFDLPEQPKQVDLSKLRPEPRLRPEQEPEPDTPQPEPSKPEPAPEPTPQLAPAPEPTASTPPTDPKVAALVEMAATPVANPGQAALLKPVETLTEPEMKDMLASAQTDYRGWRSGDPLKAHTYERVQDWHVAVYGDGEQTYDGGKPVEARPVRPIAEQPSPHVTPQGEDLWRATARIGQKVADAAAGDGADVAVKSLQRGLNILGEANPLPKRSPAYGPYTRLAPLAEDGQYGPRTDFALKHATARLGPTKVDEALALGRFNTFARDAQRNGNPDGLEDKTHAIFGPLLRRPGDAKAPKVEAGVLQQTLNGFGHDLKVDDWIGPKTTEAFRSTLQDQDADEVTRRFGKGLGLL